MNIPAQRTPWYELVAGKACSMASLFILALSLTPTVARAIDPVFVDRGLETGFQDTQAGFHKRGRALVAADFDLNGYVDFFVGSPGDAAYVLKTVMKPSGKIGMQMAQLLSRGDFPWGGVALDYDNDGDYDLFVTGGGNERTSYNTLYRNELMETGKLSFTDVTAAAGVSGRSIPGQTEIEPVAGAGAVAVDYDGDALTDIFVSVNVVGGGGAAPDGQEIFFCGVDLPPLDPTSTEGKNILWHNNGDGTFSDVTDAAGLGTSARRTRHSTFLDIDNDGDFDLFEQNRADINILWRNRLKETGFATFEDVTDEFSNQPLDDLHFPLRSFVSAAADFNNDGWEDLAVFSYTDRPDAGSPYTMGHALFINESGESFTNVADDSGLNFQFEVDNGTMGCQVGDLNADGYPDVYIGNGGPSHGQNDQLFISSGLNGTIPTFTDSSLSIDYPAPEKSGLDYAPYPYRTHGTAFVDIDNDGILEIAVASGGPAASPDTVREPNRLFALTNFTYNYLKVRPVGDGVNVSMDAIGTRLALTVSNGTSSREIYRTLFAGSCFSAQNGFELHFGLQPADRLESLKVRWPDGKIETITTGLALNSTLVVNR